MKTDSSLIDKRALQRLIEAEYGLRAAALRFVPRGEESYGYVLCTAGPARYFVKVYEHPAELDVRYEVANKLHTRCGLEFVVHPHATRGGAYHAGLGEYAVAVYDYVDGTVSDWGGFGDDEWREAAVLTASLHESVRCPALPPLPMERFEPWFEGWLSKVLDAAGETGPQDGRRERQARRLLAREKDGVLAALAELERLAEQARATTLDLVLTHGDLNPGNLIRDGGGRLHLIDWSKTAIAPPERDLVNFCGERFELFLEAYAGHFARAPRLRPELFGYYGRFLDLWGIADYGSWILLEDGDAEGKEHAWAELRRLLPVKPIRTAGIARAIRRVTGASG